MNGETQQAYSYCPLCGTSQDAGEVTVLGEGEDSDLLHLTCGNCSNGMIALVTILPTGISSIGTITDMMGHEVVRFNDAEPISDDDVLDIHSLMEKDGGTTFMEKVVQKQR